MSQQTNTTEVEIDSQEPVATDTTEATSESPDSTTRSTSVDGETRSTATDTERRGTSNREETTEQTDPDSLSLDHIFGILKNQRRRHVLDFLYETDGQASLSEAAEQIAAQENDKSVKQISSAERKRVYVGLYQCHLPKMDSMGIVSFNKPRGTIELGQHAPEVYNYIDTDDETSDPQWHERSVVLSLSGAGVLVAALAIQPMTTAPVMDVAVATIIVSFFLYALVGLREARSAQTSDEQSSEQSAESGPKWQSVTPD